MTPKIARNEEVAASEGERVADLRRGAAKEATRLPWAREDAENRAQAEAEQELGEAEPAPPRA